MTTDDSLIRFRVPVTGSDLVVVTILNGIEECMIQTQPPFLILAQTNERSNVV